MIRLPQRVSPRPKARPVTVRPASRRRPVTPRSRRGPSTRWSSAAVSGTVPARPSACPDRSVRPGLAVPGLVRRMGIARTGRVARSAHRAVRVVVQVAARAVLQAIRVLQVLRVVAVAHDSRRTPAPAAPGVSPAGRASVPPGRSASAMGDGSALLPGPASLVEVGLVSQPARPGDARPRGTVKTGSAGRRGCADRAGVRRAACQPSPRRTPPRSAPRPRRPPVP